MKTTILNNTPWHGKTVRTLLPCDERWIVDGVSEAGGVQVLHCHLDGDPNFWMAHGVDQVELVDG